MKDLLTLTVALAPGVCLWIGYVLGERHGRALGLLRARTIAIEAHEQAVSEMRGEPDTSAALMRLARGDGALDVSDRLRRESEALA